MGKLNNVCNMIPVYTPSIQPISYLSLGRCNKKKYFFFQVRVYKRTYKPKKCWLNTL